MSGTASDGSGGEQRQAQGHDVPWTWDSAWWQQSRRAAASGCGNLLRMMLETAAMAPPQSAVERRPRLSGPRSQARRLDNWKGTWNGWTWDGSGSSYWKSWEQGRFKNQKRPRIWRRPMEMKRLATKPSASSGAQKQKTGKDYVPEFDGTGPMRGYERRVRLFEFSSGIDASCLSSWSD